MGGLAEHLGLEEDAAPARLHHIATRTPSLGVEYQPGFQRLRLYDRPADLGTDFLIAGEQRDDGDGRLAHRGESSQHEGVHHQPRLHVRDAGPIGPFALEPEWPSRDLAGRKDRVAMAEQHGRASVRAATEAGGEDITAALERNPFAGRAGRLQERLQHMPNRIDACFVVAIAVNVYQPGGQLDHRVAAIRNPVQQFLFPRVQHPAPASSPDLAPMRMLGALETGTSAALRWWPDDRPSCGSQRYHDFVFIERILFHNI
jgi:hypothetical protein